MPTRTAEAEWKGNLAEGAGRLKVGSGAFVQIHKSLIVNLAHVESYKSRLNGDYDITMSNGTSLRLSRTYARAFKAKFEGSHQDTV